MTTTTEDALEREIVCVCLDHLVGKGRSEAIADAVMRLVRHALPVPDVGLVEEADIKWFERFYASGRMVGHCGEGLGEAKARHAEEDRYERILDALRSSRPSPQALSVEEIAAILLQVRDVDSKDQFTAARTLAQAIHARIGAGGGWRPIESAPRDGTPFIGLGPAPGDGKVEARETYWSLYQKGSRARAAFDRGEGPSGNWCWSEPIHNWQSSWHPTHWQPLPPPPSQSSPSGEE